MREVAGKGAGSGGSRAGMVGLGIWLLVAGAGCGGYMAQRLAQAPNTYPRWMAPSPPVVVEFGEHFLTNFPPVFAEVGNPPVRLRYRVVEAADYQVEVRSTNWVRRGRERFKFSFRGTVPGVPTEWSGSARGLVVLLHGYGVSQVEMVPWALRLAQDGWRCVLVDLRGHGKSTGKRIYYGVQEAKDLGALLDELGRGGWAEKPVVVFGYSYGAVVALRWRVEDPRVSGVVAVAPYAELGAAIRNIRNEYARLLPRACVDGAIARLPGVVGVAEGELDPVEYLGRGRIAVLLVAGERDRIAPVPEVERLHALASSESTLRVVGGATHESVLYRFDALVDPVLRWFESVRLPSESAGGTPDDRSAGQD